MIRLLVFFTFGISLRTWHNQGLLDRELLIYKKMAKDGYKIGFLTYGDNTDLELKDYLDGIEIFPIYSYIKKPHNKILEIFSSFLIPFKLAQAFKDYDIYKTNQMLGSWVAVIAKFLYKKRLVVRCGYEWLKNSFRESRGFKKVLIALFGYPLELVSYGASDKIIVSSLTISKFINKAYRLFAHKVIYIPNFIDTEKFKRMDVNKTFNNRALYVGRLSRAKNLINLFKAIKGSASGFGLDIIGDSYYLKELKKFIIDNNIDVHFLGYMPNSKLPHQINRYQVFVLPSFFENNPKALLEAMACERVVVGTDVEGIRDLIDDNISGILVPTDVEGIREGLKRAFGLSDKERLRMGERARDIVKNSSSLDIIFKKEMDIYEGLHVSS